MLETCRDLESGSKGREEEGREEEKCREVMKRNEAEVRDVK